MTFLIATLYILAMLPLWVSCVLLVCYLAEKDLRT